MEALEREPHRHEPNNNTMGAISVGYATTTIPDHSKTYYEFKVSGAAIQTAFTVGFGVHGFDPSNKNIHNIGAHIGNATFLGFSYNLTETNSGNVVYDPQGNSNYAATHPGAIAAPNQWGMVPLLACWLTGSITTHSSH